MQAKKKAKRANLPRKSWEVIKAKAVAGVKLAELARQFGVTSATIKVRASKENWPTPLRIAFRKKEIQRSGESLQIETDDPVKAIAKLWLQREADAREQTYQQTSKALDRFFAMNPVPADFKEAAIAAQLRDKAIKPDDDSKTQHSLNVAFLTGGGMLTKPVDAIDV